MSNNNIQVESIVINRPIEQIWKLISNLKLLIQTLFQENKENVNISEEFNQDTGKYYICLSTKNQTIKYQIQTSVKMKDKCLFSISKEINGNKANKKINFLLIQLSPMASFVCIESEIPFYIDGEFFSSLSQFIKIQLKKIKNKCDQMGCITAEK